MLVYLARVASFTLSLTTSGAILVANRWPAEFSVSMVTIFSEDMIAYPLFFRALMQILRHNISNLNLAAIVIKFLL